MEERWPCKPEVAGSSPVPSTETTWRNMMIIEFKIRKNLNQDWVAHRIASIVVGDDSTVALKPESTTEYDLHPSSNNWWLYFRPDGEKQITAVLNSRYSQPDLMKALKTVILWALRVEDIQDKDDGQ